MSISSSSTKAMDDLTPPESSVGNDSAATGLYVVEKFLKQRFLRDGSLEYLVKWQGYSDMENTWEPAEGMSHLPELIEELHAEMEKNKKKHGGASGTTTASTPKPKSKPKSKPRNKSAGGGAGGSSGNKAGTSSKAIKVEKEINAETEEEGTEKTGNGFQMGWDVSRIVGASYRGDDGLHFLVKFKDQSLAQLIGREECNKKCPLHVIRFYEERMEWVPNNTE